MKKLKKIVIGLVVLGFIGFGAWYMMPDVVEEVIDEVIPEAGAFYIGNPSGSSIDCGISCQSYTQYRYRVGYNSRSRSKWHYTIRAWLPRN